MRNKYLLATMICILATAKIFSQVKLTSKCEVVNYLINSKEVNSWFRQFNKFGDSTLIFLDPDNLVDTCKITSWKGVALKIIKTGGLIDSLEKYEFNYLVRGRYNYYVIQEGKNNDKTWIIIRRGYDNLGATLSFKKKNKYYYLGKIECWVE